MPEENGIIRWRDLNEAMNDIRSEIKSDMSTLQDELRSDSKRIEQGQVKNSIEIASIKTELRIWGSILIALLLLLMGLIVNHMGVSLP